MFIPSFPMQWWCDTSCRTFDAEDARRNSTLLPCLEVRDSCVTDLNSRVVYLENLTYRELLAQPDFTLSDFEVRLKWWVGVFEAERVGHRRDFRKWKVAEGE